MFGLFYRNGSDVIQDGVVVKVEEVAWVIWFYPPWSWEHCDERRTLLGRKEC